MSTKATSGGTPRASLEEETELLLARLDLSPPALGGVRATRDHPGRAAAELLAYYRSRKTVHHPEEYCRRQGLRDRRLCPRVKAIADDALRNILITTKHHPRHDFGAEIDWFTNRNPLAEDEWLWQLHRHSSWKALGRAYATTGREKYARAYVRQLLDWIAECPPPERPSAGRNGPAWRTIETGMRGYSWTGMFQQFLDSPSFGPGVLVRFLNCLYAHAEHLVTHREFSRTNWGAMEAEGAAFIAVTFPEFRKSPGWRRKAFRYLASDIHRQVRPDGMQFEQCMGYHTGCIGWFSRTARLANMNNMAREFPARFWKKLEKMCEVPMKMCLPDGLSAQFGDDSSRKDCRAVLSEWAPHFEREDFAYVAGGGSRGRAPRGTAHALEDSGFYSMRSSWSRRATCLVLKCGPDGGWHCQPDNGSFEIFAGGRRLTPDSGTYIYTGNARAARDRAWFRQTRVHGTMTLDGQDTAYKPRLRLWKPGKRHDLLVVENAGYPGFTHRRAVIFVDKKFFVFIDEALGRATGNAFLHFQLPPVEALLDARHKRACTQYSGGTNLLVAGMPQPGLRMFSEKGLVSFKYGRKQPRPALRYQLKKESASLRFVTALVPFEGEPPPEVNVELAGNPRPGANRVELEVTCNGRKQRISYRLK